MEVHCITSTGVKKKSNLRNFSYWESRYFSTVNSDVPSFSLFILITETLRNAKKANHECFRFCEVHKFRHLFCDSPFYGSTKFPHPTDGESRFWAVLDFFLKISPRVKNTSNVQTPMYINFFTISLLRPFVLKFREKKKKVTLIWSQ